MGSYPAERVQEFYERYPYPPSVESLDRYRARWMDGQLRRQEHHLFWPARPFRDDHSILVAGCGTSQAARYAMRWPSARVVGIDFSEQSLRCTQALQRKHHLDNLELRLLPVERAPELAMRFDQVICTGVLHHLADPLAGLRALREVLAPDGAVLLMVYAPYGRAGVYMLQEYCRRVGIPATDDGIRELVATLGALPPDHPLARLRDAPDFQHPAAVADALLHPQDRAYSVAQLFELLASGGMEFRRWVRQAPYSRSCGRMVQATSATRFAALPPVQQFAAVELLRGTMLRHSVIAVRDDDPKPERSLTFDGDACLDYRPIRLSDTISVHERVPPGAATVLINRNHEHTDLVLPISAVEEHWYDAVDGQRTIGEIAAASGEDCAAARAFFERLWWHDQVVFDASTSGGGPMVQ